MPATTRQTAGPGFAFEDLVSAWIVSNLLVGQRMFGVGLDGAVLQSQTGALGWEIDDLLISTNDQTRQFAISCKSNFQVSSKGLPKDFVERVWQQWAAGGGLMQKNMACFGLVTRGRHPAFDPIWADIAIWAKSADENLALAKIRATKKHATVFDSIKSPNGTEIGTDQETISLIRRLTVIPLDFQLDHPTSEADAIGRCRQIIQSGSTQEAEKVWKRLVQIAEDTRVGSGTVTMNEIWNTLRFEFDLEDRPNFEGSWDIVRALSNDSLAGLQNELPTGISLPRSEAKEAFFKLFHEHRVTVIIGESGTGKSALVHDTLDMCVPSINQIWLGPEQANAITSEVGRRRVGLAHPLTTVLLTARNQANVLVLDAVEKLDLDAISRVKKLIDDLLGQAEFDPRDFWRIVVICQTEAWRDRVQMEMNQYASATLPVATIQPDEVKQALRSSTELRWLSFREEAVSALTNLKTLSWVLKAAGMFVEGNENLTTPSAFVDVIWSFWTEGQAGPQNLLIRLAEREANFERSFAISELDAADVQIFQNKTQYLPLRKNQRNRIEFEHDLAAEWVRFQRLKEISHDVGRWSLLADNPLWTGALRLLGQFLLRQRTTTSNEWIEAFSDLETRGATLAADILLDSVFLDPEAAKYLFENKDFLFKKQGKYLQRLLQRFLQVATVSDIPLGISELDHDLTLFMETQYRSPILSYWPPVAYFLHQHIELVADLVSPIVAKTCNTWCSKMPRELADGSKMPWRREFAEIALATAKSLQVDQGKGTIYLGDGERPIYKAVFASMPDMPDEVTAWALEISQRGPKDTDVALRISRAKSVMAQERAKKLKSDPELRKREADRTSRLASMSSFIDSSEPLPPWPMGPQSQIENDFQHVVLHDDVLLPMMSQAPELASEILLANLIEANPRQEYSKSAYRDNVGLNYDHTYPTIFWKSPFWRFLHVQPEAALSALIKLVDFATERWSYAATLGENRAPPSTSLRMKDGSTKTFVGNWDLYDWSQKSSTSNGQLHCALNALEKWLFDQLEGGADIDNKVEQILRSSNSLALIGLLVNVGKHSPQLFNGPLFSLVGCEQVFLFDAGRLKNSGFFDAFAWSRAGELAFNMARDWAVEPYRQSDLVEVVVKQLAKDEILALKLNEAKNKWDVPDDPKSRLEQQILIARLDPANYTFSPETEGVLCNFPPELLVSIQSFQNESTSQRTNIMLADNCRQALAHHAKLSDDDASSLWVILCAPDVEEEPDDECRQALNKAAAAAALTVLGSAWLQQDPDREVFVKDYLRRQVKSIESFVGLGQDRLYRDQQLNEFLAYSVFHNWYEGISRPAEWETALLKILTSGDNKAAGVIGALAYRGRQKLGQSWLRIVKLGVLWSALSMLEPDQYDPEIVKTRWKRWRDWLCRRKISEVDSQVSKIDFSGVWSKLKKLEKERWRRAYATKDKSWARAPEDQLSHGLDTQFLSSFLYWLTETESEVDAKSSATTSELLLSAFGYQADYCQEHKDERGEYGLPPQFGYDVVQKLAFQCARGSDDYAKRIYQAVLGLGPAADHMIDQFMGSWFIQLHKPIDTEVFCSRWKSMIQFGMEGRWAGGGSWYDEQKLLRKILGFEHSASLKNIPNVDAKLGDMSDLYKTWASANLKKDEQNVSSFAYFLKSEVGEVLRVDGLKWLATSLTDVEKNQYWRDSRDTGASLVDVIDKALRDQKTAFQTDSEARQALLKLTGLLVSEQVPSALALQQKISTLR